MIPIRFPVIDPVATGENIEHLRKKRGYSVKQVQEFFGFDAPQAVYQWQRGANLPSIDNLYALSILFDVPMNDIIVPAKIQSNIYMINEPQMETCGSSVFYPAVWGNSRTLWSPLPFVPAL